MGTRNGAHGFLNFLGSVHQGSAAVEPSRRLWVGSAWLLLFFFAAVRLKLQARDSIGSEDQTKCQRSDNNLSQRTDDKGTKALFRHFTKVGPQTNTGKR
jgi:hypothetical protein